MQRINKSIQKKNEAILSIRTKIQKLETQLNTLLNERSKLYNNKKKLENEVLSPITNANTLKKTLVNIDPASQEKYTPNPGAVQRYYYNKFLEEVNSKVLPRITNNSLKRLVNKTKELYQQGHSIAWMNRRGVDPWKSNVSNKDELRRIIKYSMPVYPRSNQEGSMMQGRMKRMYHTPQRVNLRLTESVRLYPRFKERLNQVLANKKLSPQMQQMVKRAVTNFKHAKLQSVMDLRSNAYTSNQINAEVKRLKQKAGNEGNQSRKALNNIFARRV